MTVPDEYEYIGKKLFAQVGNGVCPNVAAWVANTLVDSAAGNCEPAPTDEVYHVYDYTDRIPEIISKSEYRQKLGVKVEKGGKPRMI